ncbi:MAG: prephenate dehydrogenase/arogenate dehydrogenase family protein [Candidatus Hermodarchaeota archaeon]
MIGKNIAIIGGSGGMGKVFAKYFKNHGFKVILYARTEDRLIKTAKEINVEYRTNLKDSVKEADIVMVSIPISSTTEMITKLAPYLKRNAILFDISSVKTSVFKALDEARMHYPINCISLHPMFGPGIDNMKNYVMIFLKVGGTKDYEVLIDELLQIFKSDGLLITETTQMLHDKLMALTLGIPHMLNIVFLNLLKKSNFSLRELTKCTGTTFLLQKVFAESIIQREMDMFGEIQMENHEFLSILDSLEILIKDYKKIISTKDINQFNKLFTQGLNYSKDDDHFKNSYKFFYEFINILKK